MIIFNIHIHCEFETDFTCCLQQGFIKWANEITILGENFHNSANRAKKAELIP